MDVWTTISYITRTKDPFFAYTVCHNYSPHDPSAFHDRRRCSAMYTRMLPLHSNEIYSDTLRTSHVGTYALSDCRLRDPCAAAFLQNLIQTEKSNCLIATAQTLVSHRVGLNIRPYKSSLVGPQRLCGFGGWEDKSIDKKSCTMSAAAIPVISAMDDRRTQLSV